MKGFTLLSLLIVCLFSNLSAQTDTLVEWSLNEIVISATKYETPKRKVSQQVEIIDSREIAIQNNQNAADLLMNSGEVLVQRSQGGGGSPIIRGFEANKVLIEIDGLRLNNAIFRGGHLQNVLRIDNNMIDRLEILFGPSSVLYGSDALGGVMHFITKKPQLNSVGGNAYARYSTANEEKTGHVDLNFGGGKIASLTSFTYSDFGDITQGGNRKDKYSDFGKRTFYVQRIDNKDVSVQNADVDKQVGTAYSQYDILQKILFQSSESVSHTLNLQYSNSSDVNRYDRLTEGTAASPSYAQWYYGPEERLLASYRLDNEVNGSFIDDYSIILAYQNAKESRNSRRFNSSGFKHQYEEVKVASFDFDASKQINKHKILFGVEAYLNWVDSKANRTNISNNTETPSDTRYPGGGSTMNSYAIYLQDNIDVSDKVIANIGLRYNYTTLEANFDDKTFFPFPYTTADQQFGALSGMASLVLLPSDKTKIALIGSTGFRSPNIDDLAKVFDSVKGAVVVPNPNITPEYTYNAEINWTQWLGNTFQLELGGYYTWLHDAIVLGNFQLNGQDSIAYDGVNSQVLAYQNNQKAHIAGARAGITFYLTPALQLRGTVNYTRGRVDGEGSSDTPLDHIPPVFGKVSLAYEQGRLQAELWSLFNSKKDIKDYLLNAEDNEKYATPDGMPAWNTLNIRAGYQLIRNLTIQLALENILDTNYRVFASGVSAPGRNFSVTLRGSF